MTYGSIELSSIKSKEVISFYRQRDQDKVLVIHNITNKSVNIPLDEKYQLDFQTGNVELNEKEIVLPAYTTALLVR